VESCGDESRRTARACRVWRDLASRSALHFLAARWLLPRATR